MSHYLASEATQNELELVTDGLSALSDLVLSHDPHAAGAGLMAVEPQQLWVLIACLRDKARAALAQLEFVPGPG